MNIDFEKLIFVLVLISGCIALLDKILLAGRRQQSAPLPMAVDYARSLFPVLLFVFMFRSFGFEAFRIPSGSLKPTLLVGDFILVNKFAYGLRVPLLHRSIIPISQPQHGDIVVFREPATMSKNLIKRVIGVPGDHISYINKVLYINGKEMPQEYITITQDHDEGLAAWTVEQRQENLFGIKHGIYQIPARPNDDFQDVIVPPGHYFMMGDNRDDSADSRVWGFMPDEDIIGKAVRVIVSVDNLHHPLRFERTGKKIVPASESSISNKPAGL